MTSPSKCIPAQVNEFLPKEKINSVPPILLLMQNFGGTTKTIMVFLPVK